jgi:hypothetical protein
MPRTTLKRSLAALAVLAAALTVAAPAGAAKPQCLACDGIGMDPHVAITYNGHAGPGANGLDVPDVTVIPTE